MLLTSTVYNPCALTSRKVYSNDTWCKVVYFSTKAPLLHGNTPALPRTNGTVGRVLSWGEDEIDFTDSTEAFNTMGGRGFFLFLRIRLISVFFPYYNFFLPRAPPCCCTIINEVLRMKRLEWKNTQSPLWMLLVEELLFIRTVLTL